ncbi:hypothetical protein HY212_00185 [Candidatus Pacearchaeota archaeon]|nr:hypothetical protein [Candidatus Pacearchaeota archaeon]
MVKTPSEKWQADISIHRKKCQKILLSSKSVRYVGLINEYGRTLTGIIRPDTKIYLKSEPARNEFFLISTLLTMRRSNDNAIGIMDCAIFKHDKVTFIAFQRKEGIYYISVDQKVSLDSLSKIINKIKKLI